jgi:aminoglycoside phosphotransferase (APT) family kinase protein
MPSAAKRSSAQSELRRARKMAAAVLEHHFGKPARRLTHRAAGLSNHVFKAEHPEGEFVVRIAKKPEKLNAYIKEQWAIRRVHELGVPTAEVLEVGSDVIGVPYMIVRCVRGEEAIHHPLRLDVLRDMGRYTALINSVPTTGFGRTFEWSANRLSHNASWSAYLESELGLERRLEILKKHRMLPPLALRKLRELVLAIGRKRKAPSLNHGDMRLKNVIVDDAGKIVALIDWEECCSQIAPYWDVSLALHDLSIDAKQAFLEGYGLSPKEVIAMAPSLRALNIINYAPAIERAAGDRAALDQFRVRLSGALDLYAL